MKPLVICVTGPTATGKTDAAIALCKQFSGEVISMDSMQIYDKMRIGTARPTEAEMLGVSHHMMAFMPPVKPYTVADYQTDARQVMHSLHAKNILPVFAGGTGLYLQAASRPLQFTQASGNQALRDRLLAEAETEEGRIRLYSQLQAIDFASAQKLHHNNARRVIRALEVYKTTGIPMSAQNADWEGESDEDWLVFGLTWPREILYERINKRVDVMIDAGLVEEVRQLLRDGVPADAQAMQAIGYKETIAYLEGHSTLEDAISLIKMNSRRYAKRQMTWFRRDDRIVWHNLSQYGDREALHRALIRQVEAHMEAQHGMD